MNRIYIHNLRELLGLVLFLFKVFVPARKFKTLSIYFHDPPAKLFLSIIKFLYSNNYRIVSLKQFTDKIGEKQLNEKIATISLDDGWRNNMKLLEVIRKYKVPITIFITTSAIEQGNLWVEYVRKSKNQKKTSIKREKVRIKKLDENSFNAEINKLKSSKQLIRTILTKEELIQLSKEPLISIGSHTVNHLSLPNKSFEVQKKELLDSKNTLEIWTGQRIVYFSYPMGDYTEELKRLAEECGYELCFSTETYPVELNKIDRFSIPRRCVNDEAGLYEALSKIFGIWYKFKKLSFTK